MLRTKTDSCALKIKCQPSLTPHKYKLVVSILMCFLSESHSTCFILPLVSELFTRIQGETYVVKLSVGLLPKYFVPIYLPLQARGPLLCGEPGWVMGMATQTLPLLSAWGSTQQQNTGFFLLSNPRILLGFWSPLKSLARRRPPSPLIQHSPEQMWSLLLRSLLLILC